VQEQFLEDLPLADVNEALITGQTVGAYKLISCIGQGGMGSVWLAERSDGRFDRLVAIKFLNFAFAYRGGAERFKREGAILGRLAHPHIAELIDAGVTEKGEPYLVLEYVKGEHIDEYCDKRGLNVNARIRLFLDVLSAVAQAHSNLIVHRDIKPSNILVRNDGQVKLLDFGIAKLLADDASAGTPTLLTVEGGGVLTPQFAAPEQLTGGSVTTATDVYALGVMLYVLLTGCHPAGVATRSPADLIKAIVNTEPPRASDVFQSRDASSAPANRSTSADKLRRQLRGDLDTILAKALKKNPQERYASVSALADDLDRYLKNEPIKARPDTITYVLSKALRRNWLPVSAALLVIASLALGLYVSHRARVVSERRFAELHQLSNQVFDLDTAIKRLPGATQARQKLVAASLEYLERLQSDIRGYLELTREVAEGYWRVARIQGVPVELNLGEPAKAEASLKKADQMVEAVLSTRPTDMVGLLRSAEIAHDRMILAWQDKRNTEAATLARKSADRMETLLRQPDLDDEKRNEVAGMYVNLSLIHNNMHLFSDAVAYARRSLDIARPVPSAQRNFSQGLRVLADALHYEGDLPAALTTIQEARRIADRTQYSDDTQLMISKCGVLASEGLILGEDDGVSLGRPDEASRDLQACVDLAEAVARKDESDATSRIRVGGNAIQLGNILRHSDPHRALAVYDLAVRRLSEVQNDGASRRDLAKALANSSYALRDLNRPSESKERIDKAFAILKETKDYPVDRVELDNTPVYSALSALADHYKDVGDFGRAVETYQELLEKIMAAKPNVLLDLRNAIRLSRVYQTLEQLYERTGKAAEVDKMRVQRWQLWNEWNGKLPNNSFVLRQVAESGIPPGRH